jgi:hypothetical protein
VQVEPSGPDPHPGLGRVGGADRLVDAGQREQETSDAGRVMFRDVVRAQPGIVIAAVDDPDLLGNDPLIWDLDEVARR